MTKQDKINRLKVYLEKCERDAKDESKSNSVREFFVREIKRTLVTIERLT